MSAASAPGAGLVDAPLSHRSEGGTPRGYYVEQVDFLHAQGDLFTRKIEVERKRAMETDRKIERARAALLQAQKANGGSNSTQAGIANAQKAVRRLEGRLEKALIKHNEAKHRNEGLRKDIENLRREKLQQAQIKAKLEREVHARKNEAAQLNVRAAAAVEARDRAQRSLEALKQTIADETSDFNHEFALRRAELEEDTRLLSVGSVTSVMSMRSTILQDAAASRKAEADAVPRQRRSLHHLSKKKMELAHLAERERQLSEALRTIHSETNIESVDELVTYFTSAEAQYYSMLNLINSATADVQALEVEIHGIQREMEGVGEVQAVHEDHRAALKADLESQVSRSHQTRDQFEDKLNAAMDVIDAIKDGVLAVFKKVGCEDEALQQQLLATGVTEHNLGVFLSLIERRLDDVVRVHALTVEGRSVFQSGSHWAHGSVSDMLSVLPPSTDDLDSDDDEVDGTGEMRPLHVAELHSRTRAVLERQQKHHGHGHHGHGHGHGHHRRHHGHSHGHGGHGRHAAAAGAGATAPAPAAAAGGSVAGAASAALSASAVSASASASAAE